MVTIKDVAYDAGVSTATVSRVLNNDTRVSKKTRQRVSQSIEQLEYRLYPAARNLKSGKSNTVGVLTPETTNYFFMFLFECFEQILHNAGYSVILCSSNNSIEREKEKLTFLANQFVDGIIAIPVGPDCKHFQDVQKHTPLVFVDRTFSEMHVDSVLVDNMQGAYNAVKLLIRDGYKNIAFVGGDAGSMTSRERYEGYKKALQESNIFVDKELAAFHGLSLEGGYSAMNVLLKNATKIDAYFSVNLMVTLGASKRMLEESEDIQKKLVCAAFDDVYYSSLISWCKYFVSQPLAEMGEIAARRILKRIQFPEQCEFEEVRLPTKLIKN